LKEVLIQQGNRFQDLDDLTIIQMVAICLRKQHGVESRNPFGITPRALDNLTTEDLEANWAECQKTILQTIKFLSDLRVHGPGMLPFAYLTLPLCYYLHKNRDPNRNIMRQWFWRHAFGLEDFRSSTEVYRFCEQFFAPLERGEKVVIPELNISKTRLIQANYNYRNALSRAVIVFLASQDPLDFSDPHAVVLDNVYLLLSQAPNLHHIYPRNFLDKVDGLPEDVSRDSLMNICFLRAHTNIQIGDKNPLTYFGDFVAVRDFDRILDSHLIPQEFIGRAQFEPRDYRDFLVARAQWMAERIRDALPDVQVTVTD
jgi:hypothetical protein